VIDAAGQPLAFEGVDGLVRMIRVRFRRLQQGHQILGAVIGRERLVDQRRQEKLGLPEILHDPTFSQRRVHVLQPPPLYGVRAGAGQTGGGWGWEFPDGTAPSATRSGFTKARINSSGKGKMMVAVSSDATSARAWR